jgi:hypothetical protein
MAGIAPTPQPNDAATLTKPSKPHAKIRDELALSKQAEWAHFMVSAALVIAGDKNSPTTYATIDKARLDILTTLNWNEAHSTYAWPDFARQGFDFNQAMRLRRQLVVDVFAALQSAGKVRLASAPGVPGTPESVERGAGKRDRGGEFARISYYISAGDADHDVDTGRTAERKRLCKREGQADADGASETSERLHWDDEGFLAEAMREMISRSHADGDGSLEGEKDVMAFAALVHDGLVRHWEGPQAEYATVPEELQRKQKAWDREKMLTRESSPELGEPQSRGRRRER